MKNLDILTNNIQNVLSSLGYVSIVSEYKCFSENLDSGVVIELERVNEQFLINLYYAEEIPENKDKKAFHTNVEAIKKAFTTESMMESCGYVDVTSEKVSTSEQIFIEKISLTGERR